MTDIINREPHAGDPKQQRQRKPRAHPRGFSLLEILVALGIIGLIMGLMGPRVLNSFSDAKVKTTRIQLDLIVGALDLFYLDTGRYPTAQEGLNALMQRPSEVLAWTGPYLKDLPKDGWGQLFFYRVPGRNGPYSIGSLGSDAREGGEGQAADIIKP
jgi:general secretion pathway protein G